MKKAISYVLAAVLIILCVGTAFANSEENVLFTLKGYKIADGDAPEDENVSRGEFAHMAVNLLGVREIAEETSPKTAYWDVPEDYKYARDISLLTQIGVLNGVSENLFSPYDSITYEQAIKVLVLITGYENMANKNGGWPGGYVSVAGQNRMLSGVELTNPLSRKALYRLIYNTLDVLIIDEVFNTAKENTLVKTNDTLRDKISDSSVYKLYKHKGIITANSYIYTTSPYSDLHDDEVVIENVNEGKTIIYKTGKTDVFELVGCRVEFFAREIDGGYELLSVKPIYDSSDDIVSVNAEQFNLKNGNTVSYTDENNKTKQINLAANIRVVYNGSRVMNPADNIYDIEDGYIRFINNDSSPGYDLAMIWEYKNAIATSFDGQRFNFKNNALYEGLTALFSDIEDDSAKMIVTDRNGCLVKSFDAERTVSIFADKNKKRFRVFVSDEQIEGAFESFDEDTISVNGKEYRKAASLGNDMLLGENYLLYINHEGKIAFSKSKNAVNYGYILKYGSKGAFGKKISAKIILPGAVDDGVEVNEEDTTDTSRVPYLILQNNRTEVFSFADNVKCEERKYSGNDLMTLLGSPAMKAISYELNANGEIREITPLAKCGGNVSGRYQYDVYDRVFGGLSVERGSGFAINSATVVACVPADKDNNVLAEASDDDLNVKVNITVANNDVGYRVEGYDFDEESKKARFLVAFASMDAAQVTDVDIFSTKASMVTSVRYVRNPETGDMEQCIDILNGDEEKNLKPAQISQDNEKIESIKKGDLICYKLNSNDLLENVSVIESISDIIGKAGYEYISGNIKKTLGTAGKIEYDEVDTYKKALVTRIEIYTGDGQSFREYEIPQKNTPPVYIYNTSDKSIKSATLKEIRPDGEEIFIFERSGDGLVRALVLIR